MPAPPISVSYFGNPRVIKHILKKKKLLLENDPKHKAIRTVLLLPGGGQRGVFEAGVTVALEKLDLVDTFDYILGSSTGAPVGYYTLCKEAALGSAIYFDENIKNHFVNFLRLWKIIDIDTLEKLFRSEKDINLDTFRNSRPKFLTSVTDSITGQGTFVDVKTFDDPLSCVVASICIPILDGRKAVLLHGKLYVDGALSSPLPVQYAIETLGATDILIVLPYTLNPMKQYPWLIRWFLGQPFFQLASKGVRYQILTFVDRFNEELRYLRKQQEVDSSISIGVIYSSQMPINEFTMDKELLQHGVLSAMSFTEKLFAR